MELGVNLGYFGMGMDADNVAVAQEADRLGYAVAWVAEAYGSDAPTVLAWVGAQTERIGLGAAVMQIPARTPAMTAMTAATLDTLSGGRFRLGLGVSGPQVSEGWHGVRFAEPLGRTREYVDIVRMALRRETGLLPGTPLHAAAARRAGQVAQADHPPAAARAPALPRGGGPEEPRAGRGDRRRLAGDLLQPGALGRPGRIRGRPVPGARAGGPPRSRWPGSTSPPRSRSASRTTWRPLRPPCAATPPSTSAAWARGSRTSTTSWPAAWGSRRPRRGSRTSTSRGGPVMRRRPCRSS